MLFHYHYWTPFVEETEAFYVANGFRITQRVGKYQGEFQHFDPPLTWDDFREKPILFRIIEARKGNVNITFGYGKQVRFDHLGFLVSSRDQAEICTNANQLRWEIDEGERRTFIHTPYGFRIELQIHTDVVDPGVEPAYLEHLLLETKAQGLEQDLERLFGMPVPSICSSVGSQIAIKEAVIHGLRSANLIDPNGVRIKGTEFHA
ncbi:hypothetical protein [Brevibacillus migulae]|uniref:hypothetical protein n=1 Tax=Brevibacillus migulae TaxID=1644114 RepID=UPI00106E4CF7|nr:hypothetical protein [Brevibacillus migulae]